MLGESLKHDPDYFPALLEMAAQLRREGNYQEAEGFLEPLVNQVQNPVFTNNPRLRKELALIYAGWYAKQPSYELELRAGQAFRQLVSDFWPTDPEGWLEYARFLHARLFCIPRHRPAIAWASLRTPKNAWRTRDGLVPLSATLSTSGSSCARHGSRSNVRMTRSNRPGAATTKCLRVHAPDAGGPTTSGIPVRGGRSRRGSNPVCAVPLKINLEELPTLASLVYEWRSLGNCQTLQHWLVTWQRVHWWLQGTGGRSRRQADVERVVRAFQAAADVVSALAGGHADTASPLPSKRCSDVKHGRACARISADLRNRRGSTSITLGVRTVGVLPSAKSR